MYGSRAPRLAPERSPFRTDGSWSSELPDHSDHAPGNVRELENAIERALVLAREGKVKKIEIQLRPSSERFGARCTEPTTRSGHADYATPRQVKCVFEMFVYVARV